MSYKRESQELIKRRQVGEEAAGDPPTPWEKTDLQRESSLCSKLQNMDIQVQGLLENIPTSKMKPNGMHRQAHVYRIKVS